MGISASGIIFSTLTDTNFSRLTADRAIGAIPFACRYRLIDFPLSNLVNANISNISIVANYNYRSLVEHIGSGKDWDLARRKGGINIVSPYQSAKTSSGKSFSTRLDALKCMKEYIDEMNEEFVILMDSDTVINLDISDVIATHERTGAGITFVTKKTEPTYLSKHPRLMLSSVMGRIVDLELSSKYSERNTELSLGIILMRTVYLKKLIEEASAYNLSSLTAYIQRNFKRMNCQVYTYNGYAFTISGFLDYYRASMGILSDTAAMEAILCNKEMPIFTRVHNSAPTFYKACSSVSSSMLADECVIEGTVINSVLFRGVRVGRGAVVKNSILLKGTEVRDNTRLNYIVSDKNVVIGEGVSLAGNANIPFYIQKGRRV